MALWSTFFPDNPLLVARKWFKVMGGPYNHAVPVGAKWCRATIRACGGYGDNLGGGGATSRVRFPVTPAENLIIQVGSTSTSSAAGDSYVKRNDGTILGYADRGRGSGTGGSEALSTGDTKRGGAAGSSTNGGTPGNDQPDTWPVMGPSEAISPTDFAAGGVGFAVGPGGGGVIRYLLDGDGNNVRAGQPGGGGLVCLEFFDAKPPL